MENVRRNRIWKKIKRAILRHLLSYLMVSSVVLGFVIGVILRTPCASLSKRNREYIGFPGLVLIRVLKCTASPLIVSSIIVAIASLNLIISREICWQLAFLVIVTKFLSASVGLALVMIIRPGNPKNLVEVNYSENINQDKLLVDMFLDLFRNIVPNNIFIMYLMQFETKLDPPRRNDTNDMETWDVRVFYSDGMNLPGIIFIAVIVGMSLSTMQDKGKGLLALTTNVYEITMKLATWILWMAPLLLIFLIVSEIIQIDDIGLYLSTWGMYIVTMNAGFLVILLVQYPLLLLSLAGVNPIKFYEDMSSAIVTAFVTASSLATMPIIIKCLLKNGVDERIARFAVPVGVSVNKDGAACALVVTCMFVAQMLGVAMSWGHVASVLVLAAMGSIVMAGVPFGGIVVVVMILQGLGLRQNMVAGIIAVEWLNDRGATCCNVLGNCCYPKILEKWNKKRLQNI